MENHTSSVVVDQDVVDPVQSTFRIVYERELAVVLGLYYSVVDFAQPCTRIVELELAKEAALHPLEADA